jgi:hypothetical protein
MDRKTAKEEIKTREPDFLEPARRKVNGHISYICPKCGNGSGDTGDGIALDPHSTRIKRYKCFVCGISEDNIGLWKLYKGTTNDKEAFDELYRYYGINIDNTPTAKESFPAEYQKHDKKEQYTHNNIHTNTYTSKEENPGNTAYYKACAEKVGKTEYLKNRGLSEAVIAKYMLGFDASYTKGTGGNKWGAVIIPTGTTSYVARNTDPEADKKDRYRKNGASQIYLKKTLTEASSPVFVVEGELDALSIIEVGGEAVGLGSTANYRQLINYLKEHRPAQPIILALDNDEDGESTAQTLATELTGLNIPFYRFNPYGEAKDANGALVENREAFSDAVRKAIEECKSIEEEEKEAQKEEYLKKTSTASHLQSFIDGIADSVNTPYIPTGFKNLDNTLDGGLYEGLYILGAISSLGKTTLALQIADQIAEAGEDVLIFSLEMARTELMAKSISRLTLLDTLQNNGDLKDAKTIRGITTGSRYKNYSQAEHRLIQRAITAYSGYAKNIYIHEGIGNIGTEQIRDAIDKHILFTGNKPVVLIDYIQILAPADIRATDKQNTDKAVLELKRISRDFKVPVMGISSVNRASYNASASMEMLKESGSLEYGSDCVLGLQLKGVGNKDFDVNTAKNKDPREVELIILKNRNGATGGKLSFEYYPKFNYFKES